MCLFSWKHNNVLPLCRQTKRLPREKTLHLYYVLSKTICQLENYHYLEQQRWNLRHSCQTIQSRTTTMKCWALAHNNNTYKLCASVSFHTFAPFVQGVALQYKFKFLYSCQVCRFDIRFWPFETFQLFLHWT